MKELAEEERPRAEPARIPVPDYRSAAPSDWMGSRAVEIMLEDLPFPASAGTLRARAGSWRVPIKGSEETVAMGDLLQPFDEKTRFESAGAVARAIGRYFYRF